MSLRRPRWLVVVVAFVGLVGLAHLSLDAAAQTPELGLRTVRQGEQLVVTWVQPAGLAWDAGVRPGDRITAVDGQAVTPQDGPAAVEDAGAVEVSSAHGTALATSGAPSPVLRSGRHRLAFLTVAAGFAAVGGAVYILANDRAAGRAVLGFSLTAATALVAAVGTVSGSGWMIALEYAAFVAFGASTFLLFLVFPIDRLTTGAGRRAGAGCLVLAAALVALYGWVAIFESAAYDLLQPATFGVVMGDLLGAAALVVAALTRPPRERWESQDALGSVALGILGGLAPFCLLSLGPYLLGLGYLLPPDVTILSVVLVPVSLAGAVLRHRFLGIDRVVRRGLVTLLVWVGLLVAYSVALDGLRRGAATLDPLAPAVAAVLGTSVVAVAVIGGTFWPVQRQLRRDVERLLFRDVYSYPRTLRRLSGEIIGCAGADDLARHVAVRLSETLDLSWAAVALCAGDARASPIVQCQGEYPAGLDAPALLAWAAAARAGFPDRAADHGRTHAVPLVVDGLLVGALAVGPKRHDVDLLPEDRSLLATLAPVVAVAAKNAWLALRIGEQLVGLGERERELAALSGQLMRTQEDERRRLALDLHDDPIQRAVLLAREMDGRMHDPHVEQYRRAVQEILDSLRATSAGLRLPALDDFGLVAGLEWLVDDVGVRSHVGVELVLEAVGAESFGRLDAGLELALYRVAQEALNNCLKHAEASRVTMTLGRDDDRVRLKVVDDGRGWVAVSGTGVTDRGRQGTGIYGMRERLRPWGGTLRVEGSPARGTAVVAEVTARRCHGAEQRREWMKSR